MKLFYSKTAWSNDEDYMHYSDEGYCEPSFEGEERNPG